MRLVKLLSLALMTVFAFSAFLSASAFAGLPELLGWEGAAAFTGENTAANPSFENVKKETFTCSGLTADGEQTSDTLGVYHWHLSGCKSSGFNCNTSGDSSGIVLMLGEFHFVYDSLPSGGELGVAILLLPEEQTIKCTALVTIKQKGHILCLFLKTLEMSKDHEYHCVQTGGKPSSSTWWNDEGTQQTAQYLQSKNGGEFVETAALWLVLVFFSEADAFMNE